MRPPDSAGRGAGAAPSGSLKQPQLPYVDASLSNIRVALWLERRIATRLPTSCQCARPGSCRGRRGGKTDDAAAMPAFDKRIIIEGVVDSPTTRS